MIIVIMGVAGAGKTTIGTLLAQRLGCAYLEGDLLHPESNIAAMRGGVGLTDAQRLPWLAAIHQRIANAHAEGRSLVVGCSALRQSYRRLLSEGVPVIWVYLTAPRELLTVRLQKRAGHFAGPDLLGSQFETLEEPADAIIADASQEPAVVVEEIHRKVTNAAD